MDNRTDDWMAAMRNAEHQQQLAEEKRKRKRGGDANDDVLGDVTGAAGRAVGRLTKEGRAQRKAERAARAVMTPDERAERKRTAPKPGDVPKVTGADMKLKLRATVGHLTLDDTEVYAWYAVMGISHGFQPIGAIEDAIRSDAVAYSKLSGKRIKVRTTTRPYSVRQWAKDTYDDARRAGDPLPGFGKEFLRREQEHMQSLSFSEKWVYLGVRLSTFRRYGNDPVREVHSLRHSIESLTSALATSTLAAVPASREDMEWLLRRSVCLGVPMPAVGVASDYERTDIAELEAQADWTSEPMSKHLTVTAKAPGTSEALAMKVTILTLGRLSDQAIPQEQQTGWMQRTDRLPFPVEWAATVDVIPEERTQGWIRGRMDVIRDQMKHYQEEHGIAAPASLNRQMAIASDIQASLDSDHGGTAIRTMGWYRVAVAAPTVDLLNERVAQLRKVYGSRAEFVEVANQYHTALEFIPGEKLSTGAYRRRMSVLALAAAIPQGTAEIGDRQGVVLGHTAGSAMRAVAWDLWADMEQRDRSGLCILAGGLGSGKTYTGAGIMYRSVMSGVRWFVLDPSDRLGRLCELPELKGRAKYINLMKGREGELNPYRVVAEPARKFFDTDSEYHNAIADAEGTRTSLMTDVLYSFLSKTSREDALTGEVITRAMSEVQPLVTSSPAQVLTALEQIAQQNIHQDLKEDHRIRARTLLIEYNRLAATPIGKLIFPPAGAAPLVDDDDDATKLSVYTLNGMSVPSAEIVASGALTEQARLSIAVMTLAAWLVQSKIYLGDANRRKGLLIDEGKQISTLEAGKSLITKSATDSRKFNLRFLLMSQNVTHFDVDSDSEDSLGNLVGAALIGHTEDDNAVNAALKVLRAPQGQGYEQILKVLRPKQDPHRDGLQRDFDGNSVGRSPSEQQGKRQFIFSDGRNVERIVFDLDAHPQVAAALNSRPRAQEQIPVLTQPEVSA